eukprot:CAMPEP_0194260116 /NCGR_PEP_ID=MMETSP0158-20130606/45222_1 /TAXON_ID=33649 /ORGANISM="Thalassionema nitzschioides, Strain L26-B" /LENGTH=632 /DNA_ID=CAMNT_0039000175 /DNA_START=76 /DNA_END=1971 /DNA_ORIENTATION=-
MKLTLLLLLCLPAQSIAFVSTQSHSLSTRLSLLEKSQQVDSEAILTSKDSDQWIQDSYELETQRFIGPKQCLVYDTTLRDGTQGESVSASCDDKLKICKHLVSFGVDFVEAGWPGSNPKDAEFFNRAKTELEDKERARLVAFGSTRRKNIDAEDDNQLQTLLDSEAPTLCLVAKSHSWQVEEILRTTREENIEMIRDSVQYLVGQGRQVFVDLEHFFDGYNDDPDYSLACCQAAVNGGAKCLVLCDTNGGSMPWQIEKATKDVVEKFTSTTIGIHAHNDCGMAVANSMMASNAGAGLIQGTINGIGERTGNADLCSIVPSLALHVGTKFGSGIDLKELTLVSRYVDELLNRTPSSAAPFVGSSAFAHKGGLHVAAMERNPLSYQHINPSLVGNEQRYLISELSGRQNILGKMKKIGLYDEADSPQASKRALAILEHVKRLESEGYTFEGAEASVHLMILHSTLGYCAPFTVLDYSAQVHDTNIDSSSRVIQKRNQGQLSLLGSTARATIKVRTLNLDDTVYDSSESPLLYKDRLEVSDGSGPVDALANALKRALEPDHPSIRDINLVDYKVRILDPNSATKASTRVMIDFSDGEDTWTTVSVDENIISASLNALVDGYEYALIEHAQGCMLC